jgi:IS30 family transposase
MQNKKGNQKHLTYMERAYIEQSLEVDMSFRQIAETLEKDPSTISKEIRKHRIVASSKKGGRGFTDCRQAPNCQKQHLCAKTGCSFYCATCSRYRCDKRCADYIPTACDKLNRLPYVCNGCERRQFCRLGKYYYRAKFADDSYVAILRESRKGIDLTPEEFDRLDKLISPLIKQGQSLSHIFTKHEDEILCSKRTLYNYLGNGILTAKSIDLPRKMRYKPKRKSILSRAIPNERLGRTYMDFQKHLKENPGVSVVEMDTVYGKMGGKVMLTMLFRSSSLMLAFLMDSATRENVLEVFERLETALGTEIFQKTFPVILTDNGSEFHSPEFMECTRWGELRTTIFYCDPNASWQKGQLERNHEFIRYIIPRGRSFDYLRQPDVTLMINHINSLARESLGGMTPYETSIFSLDPKVHRKLHLKPVPRDEVLLRPSLFKLADTKE